MNFVNKISLQLQTSKRSFLQHTLLYYCESCSLSHYAVWWGWTWFAFIFVTIDDHVFHHRLAVCRVFLPSQRGSVHHEGVFSHGARSSSATLWEPFPTQVEYLAKSEGHTHEARHHHEDGEYFLLCWPEKHIVKDKTVRFLYFTIQNFECDPLPCNVAVHYIGTWLLTTFY